MANDKRFNITINQQQQQQLQLAMTALIGQGQDLAGIVSDDDLEEMRLMRGMLNDMESYKLGSPPIVNDFNL